MKQFQAHEPLARLLFVSQSTHPLGHVSDIDVFRAASRHNKKMNISGVILRGETWFCQVLEGRAQHLEATWSRISVDHRHGQCRVWWQTDAPTQLFSNWHTEHWGISPQVEKIFLAMLESNHISTADKITLVRSFAQVQRARTNHRRSAVNHVRNALLDDRHIRQPIDTAQQAMREVIPQKR